MKLKALIASLVLFTSVPLVASVKENVEASELSKQELFFNQYGPIAQEVASKNDIYASVLLAQMALESGYGKSTLASNYNNFFGMKGTYNGSAVGMDTNEDDGSGSLYSIEANFRVYESPKQSMLDYARLMNKERYKNSLKSFSNSYQKVTESLEGVYASDTLYSEKLNGMIQKYNLTQFDTTPAPQKSVESIVVQNEVDLFDLKVNEPLAKVYYHSAQVYYSNTEFINVLKEENVLEKQSTHVVVEGETLYSIANKYSTTVEKIMADNGLSSTVVYKGENLVILN